MKAFSSLSEIRVEIDRIDDALLALLVERAQCSLAVAEIKKAEVSDDQEIDFYRPEREAQVLRRMAENNPGPLDNATIVRFFREIISASLALEQELKVAYLGPEATFTHAATLKHFGSSVSVVPCSLIPDVFRAVEAGKVAFGVVPVENSTEGMINQTLDLLTESRLRICGESKLRIEHNLLGSVDDLSKISSVHAHPQALAQCRNWLDRELPAAERISEKSNAAAARIVQGNPHQAAIAGLVAAQTYQLSVIENNIEDVADNTTRFFVIGDQDIPPSGKDSTSLLFGVPHQPGGLRRILEPFENAGVSMTRIESRPSRTDLWNYIFFVDIDGHQHDEVLQPLFQQLSQELPLFRVLGSYPRAL